MLLRVQFIWVAMLLAVSASAEVLTLFTYHQKPPYYSDGQGSSSLLEEDGVYGSLAHYLNRVQDSIQVQLAYMPRKQLEKALNEGRLNGAVIGVAPLWFKDKEMETYLWSVPFLKDEDVILVRSGKGFSYKHPRDLEGKTLALTRGLYYWGVTERIKENKITAYETDSSIQNLIMVAHGRADATILSRLTSSYLLKRKLQVNRFEMLSVPHDQFSRRILFPRTLQDEYRALNKWLKLLPEDETWIENLKSWRETQ
jgi:polar amino acid transport system substrate-binding protein